MDKRMSDEKKAEALKAQKKNPVRVGVRVQKKRGNYTGKI